MAQSCAARYRARNSRATPLYRLFETHFDEVRGQWEERFERGCGFWRGFVDEHAAELLYRNKMMRLLRDVGLLTKERTELLLSWRHTGFSVHNRVRVEPEDQPAVERLARYIMRPSSPRFGDRRFIIGIIDRPVGNGYVFIGPIRLRLLTWPTWCA